MSGIRILLKGGQSIDYRGISLEEFVEEFTKQKGDVFVIGNVEGLKIVLLWSEIAGAVALQKDDETSGHREWFDKRAMEFGERFQKAKKRKSIWE